MAGIQHLEHHVQLPAVVVVLLRGKILGLVVIPGIPADAQDPVVDVGAGALAQVGPLGKTGKNGSCWTLGMREFSSGTSLRVPVWGKAASMGVFPSFFLGKGREETANPSRWLGCGRIWGDSQESRADPSIPKNPRKAERIHPPPPVNPRESEQ